MFAFSLRILDLAVMAHLCRRAAVAFYVFSGDFKVFLFLSLV